MNKKIFKILPNFFIVYLDKIIVFIIVLTITLSFVTYYIRI
jgi:hypothetical protein